jgi:hypothetical protein
MTPFFAGFQSELMEKVSLPIAGRLIAALAGRGGKAGAKLLRKRGITVKPGSSEALAMANRWAKKPGVIRDTRQGIQLGRKAHLGRGQEGVSTLVADPKRGVHVRKVIDPKGMMTTRGIRAREEAGRALRDRPEIAQFLGARTTKGGLREQRFEFVPGKTMEQSGMTLRAQPKGAPTTAKASPKAVGSPASPSAQRLAAGSGQAGGTAAQIEQLKRVAKRRGIKLHDIHEGNVIMSGGKPKVVDYIAQPKGLQGKGPLFNLDETLKLETASSKGLSTPYGDYLRDPRRPGNVMARAYKKGTPPLIPGTSPKVAPHTPEELARIEGVQRAAAAAGAPRGKGKRPVDEISTAVG